MEYIQNYDLLSPSKHSSNGFPRAFHFPGQWFGVCTDFLKMAFMRVQERSMFAIWKNNKLR